MIVGLFDEITVRRLCIFNDRIGFLSTVSFYEPQKVLQGRAQFQSCSALTFSFASIGNMPSAVGGVEKVLYICFLYAFDGSQDPAYCL